VGLEVSLLGAPRVTRDGHRVGFDTRKATALLAHLALAERARSRESLCRLLWPRSETTSARGALRRTLSTLRHAIGEEWLDATGDAIGLRPGIDLDVRRFRELVRAGAGTDDLRAAADLYSGELLEGFFVRDSPEFDQWQAAEQDALRRELGGALDRLVTTLDEAGRYGEAVPFARRWLELDPLHEPAHRALIRLYAWSGERAAALSQYRDCVRTLTRELGVAPLGETDELYAQVSEGTLGPPRHRGPGGGPAAGSPPAELPLVGRDDELAALSAAHGDALADGRLVVIEGESGIGKTRLAAELTRVVTRRSAPILEARCHEDESGLPYGAVIELLRQAQARAAATGWPAEVPAQRYADAALLLPDLADLREGLPAPLAPNAPGAQARLLEGVAAVLGAACSGAAPGVLLVDDVHAADDATFDLLTYLGRRLRGRSLLLVLVWRSEAVPAGHRLRRLASDLSREGRATVVRPGRLDEQEVAKLVRSAGPDGDTAELERRIHVESEGLPLFVAEYLAALPPAGEPMPAEVRNLLDARLGGVGDLSRQVLGAAAVVGRSFDLDTVRDVSGRSDDESVAAIDELVAHGIVRELRGTRPTYDFSHQKLRELVLGEVGPARRRLLHRRAAAALAAAPTTGGRQALVAKHLRLAGDDAAAAERYVAAAEHASSLLAHSDALDHLEAALALGHPDARDLYERMGDLRTLLGDYTGALANYERAAALGEGELLAQTEQKLGEVHHRRGEWELAEARLRAALDVAPFEASVLRARVTADLSLTLHRAGAAGAADLARQAASLAEEAGDDLARAQAYNLLGVLARAQGARGPARRALDRSLGLAEALDDAPAQVAALNNLALVQSEDGHLEEARELTERALALCTASGDRHREAALENNLADLHHAAGRPEESMDHLKRAVAIFSEVGADEATRLPEIWKLVTW
jgi:DNA-binding SARP family transcriptional activator